MPGSVSNASVTAGTVLPLSLCRSFVHSREWLVRENDYKNGESQRSALVETSRKSWKLSKRLTPAQLATLREFYEDLGGPHEPFYFYDVTETNPKYSYDETGVEATGRYTVRFEGPWNQVVGLGRSDAEVAIIQLA